MQLDKLFADVCGVSEAESGREKQRRMAEALTQDGHAVHPDTVRQWVMRDSIPSQWLFRIVALADKNDRPVNLADYL